ncbi:hypothetical protein [Streptomyces sp. MMG1121]|uniref:hypothetical protein n=1 Tax=Streptomyces sp. MMG1121 TaxID=1415544 RepID=UPI0006AF1D24|nr:hypothetical protein [Streptomyces sp. MMG1121]KOV61731.1 hypothetical protein ADK64_26990 [Streptomyces sp. MMG1121]
MIRSMSEHGGASESAGHIRRSRLYDYVDVARDDHQGFEPAPVAPCLDEAERRHREFAVLLGLFRRSAVLVPTDADAAPLTGDVGGVRWIYAFSHEHALAHFALARGGSEREWAYQRWLGARLLDVAVPAVGVPCGVALDVGTEGEGALFPPVRGIVPDAVAVDVGTRATATGDVR